MIVDDQGKFVYTDTGKGCSVQEVLFHYFGLPIEVGCRTVTLVFVSPQAVDCRNEREPDTGTGAGSRRRACTAKFWRHCLYIQREGQWAAYTIKPSDSENSPKPRRGWSNENGERGDDAMAADELEAS